MFEGILKILTADELVTVRAEKALNRLLEFDFGGDPNGEAWKVWNDLLSDINSSVLGGEELDTSWAGEVIQKILNLLWLTHEVSSPAHLIEVTNTKTTKATVMQSVALPRKPTAGTGFQGNEKNVVKPVGKRINFVPFEGSFNLGFVSDSGKEDFV